MAKDNDLATLTAEIANLELAAHSFREAARVMRTQRDQARQEAAMLRRRFRILAGIVLITLLLLLGPMVYAKETEEAVEAAWLQHLVKIDLAEAEHVALRSVIGKVLDAHLDDDDGYAVYEITLAG